MYTSRFRLQLNTYRDWPASVVRCYSVLYSTRMENIPTGAFPGHESSRQQESNGFQVMKDFPLAPIFPLILIVIKNVWGFE
jgi:hypothetical protein